MVTAAAILIMIVVLMLFVAGVGGLICLWFEEVCWEWPINLLGTAGFLVALAAVLAFIQYALDKQ